MALQLCDAGISSNTGRESEVRWQSGEGEREGLVGVPALIFSSDPFTVRADHQILKQSPSSCRADEIKEGEELTLTVTEYNAQEL